MKDFICRVAVLLACLIGSIAIWWWVLRAISRLVRPMFYMSIALAVGTAEAQVPVNWIRIDGPRSIAYIDHLTLTGDLDRELRKHLPFGIAIKKFASYSSATPAYSSYEDQSIFSAWTVRLFIDGLLNRRTVAISAPLFGNGYFYDAGLAGGNLALAFCGDWDRTACLVAVEHEFLHLLGARHLTRQRPQIMDHGAIKYGAASLRWAHRTRVQVEMNLKQLGQWEKYK